MKKNLYLSTASSEALKMQVQQQAAEQARTLMQSSHEELQGSFDRFCLAAGMQALQGLMEEDAVAICGNRYERHSQRQGRRWGTIPGKIGYHGGRIDLDRPRLRDRKGRTEIDVPSWTTAAHEDWLGAWAMNQMLINVS